MIRWPLHWSIKYALILTITVALLLASYHYLVRSTFIGKFLNGRKYPRALPKVAAAPTFLRLTLLGFRPARGALVQQRDFLSRLRRRCRRARPRSARATCEVQGSALS